MRGRPAGFHAAPSADAMTPGGTADPSSAWAADAIAHFPAALPGLVSSHVLRDCGHWIQQERPADVNRLLTAWLRSPQVRAAVG